MSIHKLPDVVINQIAAGEVVDRPVSVVKELCENALDAGATLVKVNIIEGGLHTITVIDNGSGIAKDDLSSATKRHYTSKISTIDDIAAISSFGFRGEALASIASVSEFSIASRVKNSQEGWKLSIVEGIETIDPCGMPYGTEVTVAKLFSSVPARLKFMKQSATESSHILTYLQEASLVYPQVAFQFEKEGKIVFATDGKGETSTILKEILGTETAGQMLPVNLSEPHITVSGWVGKPGSASASRPKQYVFVNRRIVEHRPIYAAVFQGYTSLIGRHEKPHFIIMVDVPAHTVDVNVHPQKREVRFVEEQFVFQKVKQAVGVAISQNRSEFTVAPLPSENKNSGLRAYLAPQLDRYSVNNPSLPLDGVQLGTSENQPKGEYASPSVYQLMNLFIVEDQGEHVNVFDQHAVHERVLYEKFTQSYLSQKEAMAVQPLLVEKKYRTVELTLDDDVYRELVLSLKLAGFTFAEDDEYLVITAVPVIFVDLSIDQFIREIIEDLSGSIEVGKPEIKEIDEQLHRRFAIMSCRGAIKSGDHLSQFEARELIKQFEQTSNRETCPHGRPVQVTITKDEMMGWFKRT